MRKIRGNIIKLNGVINTNPINLTKKHENQSSWKRVAYVDFGASDICTYYSWFLKKKYNLDLIKSIRNPHVTIVNDALSEMVGENIEEKEGNWNSFCQTYNGKNIQLEMDVFVKGNGRHYWLNVTEKSREEIMVIRNEIGLSKPFSGLHMTIGRVKDMDLSYSQHILNLMGGVNG